MVIRSEYGAQEFSLPECGYAEPGPKLRVVDDGSRPASSSASLARIKALEGEGLGSLRSRTVKIYRQRQRIQLSPTMYDEGATEILILEVWGKPAVLSRWRMEVLHLP